ncbi:MAG TPA: methyltransferase domain-containing protein [Candidatus Limnocylindrales bacterium]|nr:methyltransferase domain-containing protein [Candidatus Limnocylindrales bacterium]
MDRLADGIELLDGPLDDTVALAANLRDLTWINRHLGGIALSRRALDALLGGRRGTFALLDVGTGAGDIPAALQTAEATRGRELRVTALDSRTEVVAAALVVAPGLGRRPGFTFVVGDGQTLPSAGGSQDVVHASLVLHHLAPDEALALLREMGRVASIGIVVNDLARGRLFWLGAWLLSHTLARSRFTRRDAALSVRRAYTLAEMDALITQAGLHPIATFRGFMGHRYAIAAVTGR